MQYLIIGVTLVIISLIFIIISLNKDKINFYTKGIEENFHTTEIRNLWKLAKECNLEDPCSLYISTPTINKCISMVITHAQAEGNENSEKVQSFLKHLYDFRTRIALDSENKKGLEDTRTLERGQRLRVILKGEGVFQSKILNNGRELVISVPKKDNLIKIPGDQWVGKMISVYLWRKGDASYVFDSLVLNQGLFVGESCLYIQHTDNILRTQKRQSVRAACQIYAQMYILKNDSIDFNSVETEPGYRCLLEDISEDGAMIRIGGVGKTGATIKIQFTINNQFIMMFGTIKAVEYNSQLKQSRLHFECIHIDAAMKNTVLSYVYNIIPDDVKEINEAILQTESDAIEEGESQEVIAEANKQASEINVEESAAQNNMVELPDDAELESLDVPDEENEDTNGNV